VSAKLQRVVFEDVWHGLYGESWKGLIHDDAFAHPAKFSRALIRRIYDHVIEEGWANKGDSVVDPFGGVALGSFDAMRHGLNWYGCELEAKFVGLGNQNIALWNDRFSRMPNWGTARLLQGDSRKLVEVLSTSTCAVSSPPYVLARQDTTRVPPTLGHIYGEGEQGRIAELSDHRYGSSEGQLGAMKEGDLNLAVSSPPFLDQSSNDVRPLGGLKERRRQGGSTHRHYGKTEGQLGAMPEGQLCVSSPPFESSTQVNNTPGDITEGRPRWEGGTDSAARVKQDYADYANPENLGNMRGGFECAVSSPPYEGSLDHAPGNKTWNTGGRYCAQIQTSTNGYGQHEANVGLQRGETFWSASRLILEQLHQVIVPSGHAVFVVKAFVRDKKIVDFPGQWTQLCEAVGFRLLHHHRASLVEHSGTQGGFDEDKEIRVERKSFFRRLAEAKGSPRIDHESVLCFERR
jgi:hypothetical protein